VGQRHFDAEYPEIITRSVSEGPTATRSLAHASGYEARQIGDVQLGVRPKQYQCEVALSFVLAVLTTKLLATVHSKNLKKMMESPIS
jgi:hypothetical protein